MAAPELVPRLYRAVLRAAGDLEIVARGRGLSIAMEVGKFERSAGAPPWVATAAALREVVNPDGPKLLLEIVKAEERSHETQNRCLPYQDLQRQSVHAHKQHQ